MGQENENRDNGRDHHHHPAVPNTIAIVSDGSTLAAASTLQQALSGNSAGLTFTNALVGDFGTFTSVPPGAPAGTEVINIPPGDGETGFFEVSFTLPPGFSTASISGAANVDDVGGIYLNGNLIGAATEGGNMTFVSSDKALFHQGTNQLLISDLNAGGPSGAAFYATVSFDGHKPTASATLSDVLANQTADINPSDLLPAVGATVQSANASGPFDNLSADAGGLAVAGMIDPSIPIAVGHT